MNIGEFAIKKKYLVLAFALAIILLGAYAKLTLKSQMSPDTNPPMATVMTRYPGASAQDVVTDVAEPMEEEFGRLEGIASVKSTNQDNLSIIQLKFNYGLDIDEAAIEVQNSISRIRGKLPTSIDEPKVLKFSTSDKPVATISLSSESISMEKIRQAVMITKRTDANTIDVVSGVKGKMKELEKTYPFIKLELAQDDSTFTQQMVSNMTTSVLQSILLTIFLIMLFISALNQSLVVSISMPLVFLMTLGTMKLTGLKLDLVTLSSLILSIGFVVDASIVVVENIMTHYKDFKKDIITATMDATSEIAMPTMAGALTTLVVLFPLIFIKGFVGAMFKPLSLTLIYAISASIIIALTIIPLLTVLFNKFNFKGIERLIGLLSIPFNKLMDLILRVYVKLLKLALRNKIITITVTLILLAMSGRFLMLNGIEMLPKFDSGVSYVSIEMEPGATLAKTEAAVSNIEKYLSKEKNVISYDTQIGFEKDSSLIGDFGVMGANQALLTINLNTRNDREETIWEFQEDLRNHISHIPGIKNFVVKEQGGTVVSGNSAPLNIRISGEDTAILYKLASGLEKEVAEVNGTTNIYKSFHMDNQQVSITMNHARIQELGLNSAAVSQQMYGAVEGIKNSTMDMQETKDLDIAVKYQNEFTGSVEDLLDINVDTPTGIKVPLRDLASVKLESRANMITREDLEYTIEILGYTNNRAFSHIVSDINKIIDSYPMPKGFLLLQLR